MEIKIDSVGRLDIPKKMRTLLHWQGGDRLRISVDEKQAIVTLQKSDETCICCSSKENLVCLKDGVFVCRSCIENRLNK